MSTHTSQAPELQVSQWFNTSQPLTLSSLRGRVVVIFAFQMLCPGCVAHSMPQAKKLHALFPNDEVVILGLHTVFEHHQVMDAKALQVFLHEYQISFPVGIDEPSLNSPIPHTMEHYGLRGTPSMLVIDKKGHIQANHFGQMDDLSLGLLIGELLVKPTEVAEPTERSHAPTDAMAGSCSEGVCSALS